MKLLVIILVLSAFFHLPAFGSNKENKASLKVEQKLFVDNNARDIEINKLNTYGNFSEFGLAFWIDSKVVFSSTRKTPGRVYEGDFYNLYEANLKNWELEYIKPFAPEIRTDLHEGPVVFSSDGKEIFFTRNTYVRRTRFSSAVNRLVIYGARWDEKTEKWVQTEMLSFNDPENYSCGHPALSPDENKLYFVSDMPGGQGKTDIWVSSRQKDGKWSKPKNLGAEINTPGREMFPFICDNGNLYFSSDGYSSQGRLDVFIAERQGQAFARPVALGAPINSDADDFAFVLAKDKKNGFLSSNRADNVTDKLYHFRFIPREEAPVIHVAKLKVVDINSGEPVQGAEVKFIKNNFGEFLTDNAGIARMELDISGKIVVQVEKNGYVSVATEIETVTTKQGSTVSYTMLQLEPFSEDITFDLDIFFDIARWDMEEEDAEVLDEVVLPFLQNNPTVVIELSAHTDSRGDAQENMTLSQRRAQSAADYLINKGVDPERIVAVGYGETQLRNDCFEGVECTEEEHQQNRRVEIRVLSF